LLPLVVAAVGCTPGASVKVVEVQGSQAVRVMAVERILRGRLPELPSLIRDAHHLEITHDNGSGPPDYYEFGFIEVAPGDVETWRKFLKPSEASPNEEDARNAGAPAWWVGPEEFATLRFYESRPLGSRDPGWVGIAERTGRIYFFSYGI
jgi:hypothetical protein